jgi:hypothetical protein
VLVVAIFASVSLGCSSAAFSVAPEDDDAAPTDAPEGPTAKAGDDGTETTASVDADDDPGTDAGDSGADVPELTADAPSTADAADASADVGEIGVDAQTGCGGVGTCRKVPTTSTHSFAPVCGCDGRTYWSASYAASLGVSVRAVGDCASSGGWAKSCGSAMPCGPGEICVRERPSVSGCTSTTTGTCWVVPASGAACPAGGMTHQVCGDSPCIRRCDAVRSGKPFSPVATCGG